MTWEPGSLLRSCILLVEENKACLVEVSARRDMHPRICRSESLKQAWDGRQAGSSVACPSDEADGGYTFFVGSLKVVSSGMGRSGKI